MAIHPNEIHFCRERQKIIADSRARAQQKIHDLETFAAEDSVSKTLGRTRGIREAGHDATEGIEAGAARSRSGYAAAVFVPDESQQDASSKEPARCFSASVEDFLARILGYAITGAMWAYIAIVVMPLLYASAFNRALISLGVGFGLRSISWCGSPAVSSFSCCAAWGNGLLREQRPAWRGAGPARRNAGSGIRCAFQEEIISRPKAVPDRVRDSHPNGPRRRLGEAAAEYGPTGDSPPRPCSSGHAK